MYNKIICPSGSIQHVVKSGDTFWNLSKTYNVSVQSIIDNNPGVNANNLQIGSTLCIPTELAAAPVLPVAPTQPVTCPDGSILYIVHSGDTLWNLSRTYGVSLQSILDLNPGVDPQNLQIGSTLCIPTELAAAPVSPTIPTQPASPTMPTQPTSPTIPTQPVSPTMPTQPVSPTVPTQPVFPTMPTQPVSPTVPTQPDTCPEGTQAYTVQRGDTLWNLSQTHGVSLQSILDLNPGVNPQNLQIGSTICIPAASTPSAGAFLYMIQRCDTICGIARKFYVSVASILRINPGICPGCLQVGTCINIPINCCVGKTCRYTVRLCDTLNGIANKFNICPSDLIAANPNVDFQHLTRCQIICIPIF